MDLITVDVTAVQQGEARPGAFVEILGDQLTLDDDVEKLLPGVTHAHSVAGEVMRVLSHLAVSHGDFFYSSRTGDVQRLQDNVLFSARVTI